MGKVDHNQTVLIGVLALQPHALAATARTGIGGVDTNVGATIPLTDETGACSHIPAHIVDVTVGGIVTLDYSGQ